MKETLRKQMLAALPKILPPDPADAIKGTELIELIRPHIDKYSAITVRYNFSIMSQDPSSPIAKVERGQGYYLRPEIDRVLSPGDRRELGQLRILRDGLAKLMAGLDVIDELEMLKCCQQCADTAPGAECGSCGTRWEGAE